MSGECIMPECLLCYGDINDTPGRYHSECLENSILKDIDPLVPYAYSEINALAENIIQSSFSITGVQPKISMGTLEQTPAAKLTLVGYKGDFILKPPSPQFPQLPENEHLTMKLAAHLDIPVVPNALIPMASGEICYITKRIDREGEKKLHMEDMAQITGRLTEHKYRGSVETVGKAIYKHAAYTMFDVISFFQLLLFCFICGNTDMHLKNFSLIYTDKGLRFAPAYDLLNTAIVIDDAEESALTINGKKNKLSMGDFESLGSTLHIPAKSRENTYTVYAAQKHTLCDIVSTSFLTDERKQRYVACIQEHCSRLGL